MKLNYFKFQDGKVFWLPEYPEKPDYPCLDCTKMDCDASKCTEKYEDAIAQSLALAIEVAPEDALHIEKLIWFQFPDDQNNPSTWQPENGKVYSTECEMVKEKCPHGCRLDRLVCLNGNKDICAFYKEVARLKPKGVEIDDADIALIIEHHRDKIKWHQSRIDYLQNDAAANSDDMKDEDL